MNIDDQSDRERLAGNYTGAADGYAELWSPLIRPVGRRLLEALPWNGVRRILDVGTGTGALIPDIRQLAPAGRTVGVDCSFGMLALAARAGASLAMMDAMRLGLRADAFDVAVMAFVLFHVPEPLVALTEVRRVRPRKARGDREPHGAARPHLALVTGGERSRRGHAAITPLVAYSRASTGRRPSGRESHPRQRRVSDGGAPAPRRPATRHDPLGGGKI